MRHEKHAEGSGGFANALFSPNLDRLDPLLSPRPQKRLPYSFTSSTST